MDIGESIMDIEEEQRKRIVFVVRPYSSSLRAESFFKGCLNMGEVWVGDYLSEYVLGNPFTMKREEWKRRVENNFYYAVRRQGAAIRQLLRVREFFQSENIAILMYKRRFAVGIVDTWMYKRRG